MTCIRQQSSSIETTDGRQLIECELDEVGAACCAVRQWPAECRMESQTRRHGFIAEIAHAGFDLQRRAFDAEGHVELELKRVDLQRVRIGTEAEYGFMVRLAHDFESTRTRQAMARQGVALPAPGVVAAVQRANYGKENGGAA